MLDAREVHALAAELQVAPLRVMTAIVPVANHAGAKIKTGIRRNAAGHRRLGHLPSTVNYDVTASPAEVRVEVGFDRRGQGKLAHLFVYGSNNTAPSIDIDTPLLNEVKPFMRWVAKVGADAL